MSEVKLNANLPSREQEKQNTIVNKISENSEATGNEVSDFMISWSWENDFAQGFGRIFGKSVRAI